MILSALVILMFLLGFPYFLFTTHAVELFGIYSTAVVTSIWYVVVLAGTIYVTLEKRGIE